MTREARLTQKRLEGEILELLAGRAAFLYEAPLNCEFCQKYHVLEGCGRCPLMLGNNGLPCCSSYGEFSGIASLMQFGFPDAIPGALAIYLWLFER